MLPCILMVGPPGAGKGTHAAWLARQLGYAHVCLGDLLRNACESSDFHMAKQIQTSLNAGQLVSPEIIFFLVKRAIQSAQASAGILFDGFPRTVGQLHYLTKQKEIVIRLILSLEAEETVLLERFSGRRIHLSSGRVYHTRFCPPQVPERDDVTGEALVIRPDDRPEVVLKRLQADKICRLPLQTYWSQTPEATWRVETINAQSSIEAVRQACWQAVQTQMMFYAA